MEEEKRNAPGQFDVKNNFERDEVSAHYPRSLHPTYNKTDANEHEPYPKTKSTPKLTMLASIRS